MKTRQDFFNSQTYVIPKSIRSKVKGSLRSLLPEIASIVLPVTLPPFFINAEEELVYRELKKYEEDSLLYKKTADYFFYFYRIAGTKFHLPNGRGHYLPKVLPSLADIEQLKMVLDGKFRVYAVDKEDVEHIGVISAVLIDDVTPALVDAYKLYRRFSGGIKFFFNERAISYSDDFTEKIIDYLNKKMASFSGDVIPYNIDKIIEIKAKLMVAEEMRRKKESETNDIDLMGLSENQPPSATPFTNNSNTTVSLTQQPTTNITTSYQRENITTQPKSLNTDKKPLYSEIKSRQITQQQQQAEHTIQQTQRTASSFSQPLTIEKEPERHSDAWCKKYNKPLSFFPPVENLQRGQYYERGLLFELDGSLNTFYNPAGVKSLDDVFALDDPELHSLLSELDLTVDDLQPGEPVVKKTLRAIVEMVRKRGTKELAKYVHAGGSDEDIKHIMIKSYYEGCEFADQFYTLKHWGVFLKPQYKVQSLEDEKQLLADIYGEEKAEEIINRRLELGWDWTATGELQHLHEDVCENALKDRDGYFFGWYIKVAKRLPKRYKAKLFEYFHKTDKPLFIGTNQDKNPLPITLHLPKVDISNSRAECPNCSDRTLIEFYTNEHGEVHFCPNCGKHYRFPVFNNPIPIPHLD